MIKLEFYTREGERVKTLNFEGFPDMDLIRKSLSQHGINVPEESKDMNGSIYMSCPSNNLEMGKLIFSGNIAYVLGA